MNEYFFTSPVGKLHIKASNEALVSISFVNEKAVELSQDIPSGIIEYIIRQLQEYFDGSRKVFDLPLLSEGTDFQRRVWKELREIPYGQTTTYSRLSDKLGDPKAIRAVGRANGQNPIPIVIPCHRVIGANNSLTGYAGGMERKRWLLQHEGALLL